MPMGAYTYTIYGFVVRSEFPCPELAVSDKKPEVLLRYGEISERPAEALKANQPTQTPPPFLLHVPAVAKYLVRGGCEIVIERAANSLESDIRLWLFGSAFSALLKQRGMLALHASGIATEAGAVLFSGPSGIGKSTLVTAFIQRGYRMLADDVIGITTQENKKPLVMPGIPRVKLWEDSMDRLGIDATYCRRLRPGVAKYNVPMRHDSARRPLPLRRVYVIQIRDGERPKIEHLTKLDAFKAILEHTHREQFLDILGGRENHFRIVAEMLRSVEVCCICRPGREFWVDELVDRLENDLESTAGLTTAPHRDIIPVTGQYND
jgi:hypothetical protein